MRTETIRLIAVTTLAAAAVLSSGCATVTTGTTQSVSVITEKDVEGARCELRDSQNRRWSIPDSPGTVEVRKGDGPMTIRCKKSGFETATRVVEEVLVGATLGNVILGGGIGVVIDAVSGAAQQYPEQIVIWMRPEEWESEEQEEQWRAAKRAFEAEREEHRRAIKKAQEERNESG